MINIVINWKEQFLPDKGSGCFFLRAQTSVAMFDWTRGKQWGVGDNVFRLCPVSGTNCVSDDIIVLQLSPVDHCSGFIAGSTVERRTKIPTFSGQFVVGPFLISNVDKYYNHFRSSERLQAYKLVVIYLCELNKRLASAVSTFKTLHNVKVSKLVRK